MALVILDRFSQWLQAYACKTKSAKETYSSFQRFLGPDVKAKHVYTDNSKEFEKALADLQFSHDTSTPYRPQTNGVAERAVRKVKEGTSSTLLQSGWDEAWWPYAMVCYCFLRNIIDILADGKTAYYHRFGINFPGPKIPFGCEVKYKPSSPADEDKVHKFGDKMLPGIFLGYDQQAGGGWSGDLLLADQEELAAADSVSDVYIRRIPQKEVEVILVGGKWVFPLAVGSLQQPTGGVKEKAMRRRKLHTIRRRQSRG